MEKKSTKIKIGSITPEQLENFLQAVKSSAFHERWHLHAVTIDDQEGMKAALDDGFEPFSILTQFVPAKQSAIDIPGNKVQIVPVSVMYFRKKNIIPLNNKGEEQVITLFKKQPEANKEETNEPPKNA